MIKSKLGDQIDGWVQAAFPFLFRTRIDPNLLSVMGVLVSGVAAVAFGVGALRWGGVLVLAGGFFDLVDGVVARHQDRATHFGAFLDSTLDRLVDMALLIGIVMHYASEGQLGLVLLAGVVLVASVLTSYVKARAETVVPHIGVGVLERAERVTIIAVGAIAGLLPLALAAVAIGAIVTVIQRMVAVHREMAPLDARPQTRTELGEQI